MPRNRFFALGVWLFFIPILFSSFPGPEVPEAYNQPWQIDSFLEDAGLVDSLIADLDFEKDGTLWLASTDGLCRYDGFQWTRFTASSGLPSSFVRSVLVTQKGDLWVGTDKGAGVFDPRSGRYTTFGSESGLIGSSVRRIYEDPDGTLWFCCDRWPNPDFTGGVSCFSAGKWKSYGLKDGLPSDYVMSYLRDSAGRQWVATAKGIARKQGDTWISSEGPGLTRQESVQMIEELPDGNLLADCLSGFWVLQGNVWQQVSSDSTIMCSTRDRELISVNPSKDRTDIQFYRWQDKKLVPLSAAYPLPYDSVVERMRQAPDRSLWVVGTSTLCRWRYQSGDWAFFPQVPPPQMEGTEGQVLFADFTSGGRWTGKKMERNPQLAGRLFPGIEGAYWQVREENLFYCPPDGPPRRIRESQIGIRWVYKALYDARSLFWVLGQSSNREWALSCFNGKDWKVSPLEKYDSDVVKISADPHEGIWVGLIKKGRSGDLILRGLDGTIQPSALPDLPIHTPSEYLAADRQGIWHYSPNGLFHLSPGRENRWTPVESLQNRGFYQHIVTPDLTIFFFNGNLQGRAGVAALRNGQWEEFFSSFTGVFFAGDDGEVDIAVRGGFYLHFPGQPLNRMSRVNLPDTRSIIKGILKSKAGDYWIGTAEGVYRYRPPVIPPRADIAASSSSIAHDGSLDVRVRALKYFEPFGADHAFQVSWRYDDMPWSEYENATEIRLSARDLDHGSHRFQAQIRDANGIRSLQPAELSFQVLPVPLQSRVWFRPALGLLLLLMLFMLGNSIWHARQAARTNIGLRQEVEERIKAEKALAKANEELERRVQERTAAAIASNQSLHQEIKERQQVAEALRTSEARYRSVVENIGEGLALVDPQETFLFANRAAENIWGMAPGTMIGRNLLEFVTSEDAQRIVAQTGIRAQGQSSAYEVVIHRCDGKKRRLEITAVPQLDAEGRFVAALSVFRDVTEQRHLQEQLAQSQKMESVGRLAGGVAHDFNNLLTVINGYTELLLKDSSPVGPNRELLQEIHEAGKRAGSLTRQLLAFSRKQVLDPHVFNINGLIQENSKMIRRLIEENIELQLRLGDSLKNIKADRSQIEQVLMNLTVNARDAMPKGGVLCIETSMVEMNEPREHSPWPMKPGEYVLLAVSDTGVGIPSDILAHIFEPFFSTKGTKGTGLGLSTVYGIVKQSGGYIWVYSETGSGTVFKIYLPVCEKFVEEEVSEVKGLVQQTTGVVLLTEDDKMVRDLAGLILRTHGYEVLEAANGQEAIRLFQEQSGRIDLLLTDLIMPGMSGTDLSDRLLSIQPELKVVFMSGYTENILDQSQWLKPGQIFLQKPFSPSTLLDRIHLLLSSAPSTIQ